MYSKCIGKVESTKKIVVMNVSLEGDHPSIILFFSKAGAVFMSDTYVNVSGAYNVEETLDLQKELIDLAKAGGFHLRKFVSSEPGLLSWHPSEMI
ncbi:hypothetical protein PR048_012024 [Dryococelus australis]|uniref:Uncharacterized protein n=1 Tax=Dryococelus australis TaxID=614101 RepID=A0ABQ9HNU5_9NEOP|nr:hypothetical protein PR048_012024 [Dryococelus australis]